MNIAKLISPITLHTRNLKQKKQAIDNYNTQQIHTPISIPNELPHHQRLYFKQSQFFKSNTECDSENTQPQRPKYKKLDSSLNQIDKLKSQFAKRLKTQSYSQQKVGNKSNQRHLLRPSAAPKIGIATSEFTVACFGNQRNNIKEQTFSFQVQARSPKEGEFSDDSQNQHSIIENRNPSKQNLNCFAKHQTICICRNQFGSFIESMRAKMQNIVQKVKAIQEKNTTYKKRNQKGSKIKSYNDQNSIKTKKNKTENTQPQIQLSNKHFNKANQLNKQESSKKINKGKIQTLLQRLQLRIQKQ